MHTNPPPAGERVAGPQHILLVSVGTYGDVYPFLALGRRLRQRGHRVTMFTSGFFAAHVAQAGLDLVEAGTADEYRQFISTPELWHPRRGLRVYATVLRRLTARMYEYIRDEALPARMNVAAATFAFGARLAQERLGVPLTSICLQPSALPSIQQPPVWHPGLARIRAWPLVFRRVALAAVDLMIDRSIGVVVNEQRAAIGLPPVRRLSRWWHSPQGTACFFPEWFAPRQADWPASLQFDTFPRYGGDQQDLPQEVQAFLDQESSRPIVFTLATGVANSRRFFAASVDCCHLLRRRGILLTAHAGQVPENLPPTVRHFPHVPLSRLLPHAAAAVHAGGIGTMAEALAAGVPQLVVPLAFDQFDNAARALHLGIARSLSSRRLHPQRMARHLQWLLSTPDVEEQCRRVAARLAVPPSLDVTCTAIESLAP